MKISELESKLNAIKKEYGDIEIVLVSGNSSADRCMLAEVTSEKESKYDLYRVILKGCK